MLESQAIALGFADELQKLARRINMRDLAGIGAGTGAMLNLGARAKYHAGADRHPAQKGRTIAGDTAKGAIAAVAAGVLLKALSKGRLT
jgi:hypothetical protein